MKTKQTLRALFCGAIMIITVLFSECIITFEPSLENVIRIFVGYCIGALMFASYFYIYS